MGIDKFFSDPNDEALAEIEGYLDDVGVKHHGPDALFLGRRMSFLERLEDDGDPDFEDEDENRA